MSVGNSVFLSRSRIPTLAAWELAIAKAGFPLTLDPELDVLASTGYRVGAYRGHEAGFEYEIANLAERDAGLSKEELGRLGDRDVELLFISGSRFHDLVASTIAAAVLASITDGIFWSHEAGEFFEGDAALQWARDTEGQVRSELEAERKGTA